MKKSRTIVFLMLLCILVLALSSCKTKKPGINSGNSNNTNGIDDGVIYSPKTNVSLVIGNGISESDVTDIKQTYLDSTGKYMTSVSSSETTSGHEIIIGKTNRPLSEKAYARLSRLETDGQNSVAFVIYSNGNSVAIAFTEDVYGIGIAKSEVISYFANNYLQSATLSLNSGVVYEESFDPISRQNEKDNAKIEEMWDSTRSQLQLKIKDPELANEIIEGLKNLYSIYRTSSGNGITSWIANLYCPENGGFYYSNSARDNLGYLPDLESTSQALVIIEEMLSMSADKSLGNLLGENTVRQIISFVKSKQDSNNGYFYHPQWTKEATDALVNRRGRDLSCAVDILKRFGASPTYDTPSGIKGDGVLSDGTPVSHVSVLTTPIVADKILAVSKVIAINANDSEVPSHLRTKEAFEEYLASLDINGDSYSVGNTLESQASEIAQRDKVLAQRGESYRLADILIDWITEHQNPRTGLWKLDDSTNYSAVNGLLKLGNVYQRLGYKIPNSLKAFEAAVSCITSENVPSIVCDIFNTWYAMNTIYSNLNKYGTASEKAEIEELRVSLFENYPELIRSTREKLLVFIKEDGSFSFQQQYSSPMSQGMPVAVNYSVEGDVNATMIASISTPAYIYMLLGISKMPIFTLADKMEFQSIMIDMGAIIKNESVPTPSLGFEQDEVGETPDSVTATVRSSGSFVVVEKEDGTKALQLTSLADGKGKGSDDLTVTVDNSIYGAPCNILDIDICVLPGANGYFSQITLAPYMFMFGIYCSNNIVTIREESHYSATSSFSYDLGVSANAGEWFNLRIECYTGTSDTFRAKIFFNGECVAVSDNYYDANGNKASTSVLPDARFTSMVLKIFSTAEATMLVDNILVRQTFDTYVPESNPDDQPIRNVDAPESEQKKHQFEDNNDDALPDGFVVEKPGDAITVVDTSNGKKLSFKSLGTGTSLGIPLNYRGSNQNSGVFEAKLTIKEESAVGTKYAVSFDEFMAGNTSLIGFHILVAEDSNGKFATVAETSNGKTGTVFEHIRIPLGEEFLLRIEFFFEESAALVFANGELCGASANVASGQKQKFFGEVWFKNITPTLTSEILIDDLVCERVESDYENSAKPEKDQITHSFNSIENGVELNGLVHSNGTISFSETGSIKIPVNSRSKLSNYGLIGMNVTTGKSDNGEITVAFTDKSGSIISAFVVERNVSEVLIYEVTQYGKYSKPIASVANKSFNLTIEYSNAEESFNILINNNCVAVSSVGYSEGSFDNAFEYALIYCTAPSTFSIDDAIVETSGSLFTKYTFSTANPDSSSQTMTYEESSYANIPSKVTPSYISAGAKLRTRISSVYGNISRVLEFFTTTGGTDMLSFTATRTEFNYNAVAFETDMKIDAKDALTFEIEPMAGSTRAYKITVSASKDGSVKMSSADFSSVTLGNEGEWFHIRVEYSKTEIDYTGDGSSDILVKVFINYSENPIATGYTSFSGECFDASEVKQLRIFAYTNANGAISFDNTTMEQFTMVHHEPPVVIPDDTDVLTYENGKLPTRINAAINSENGSFSIADMTISNAVSKVLKFTTSAGANDYIEVYPTRKSDNYNAIALETDIMLSPSDSISLDIEPRKGNDRACKLVLTATKGGVVKISGAGISSTVLGKVDEWFHLRIEYANTAYDYTGDGIADILLKVFVDGSPEPIAIGYTAFSDTHIDATQTSVVRLFAWTSSSGSVYFDNTVFEQFTMDIVAPPSTEPDAPIAPPKPDEPIIPDNPENSDFEKEPFDETPGGSITGDGWTQ